jgi:hypothetical protein
VLYPQHGTCSRRSPCVSVLVCDGAETTSSGPAITLAAKKMAASQRETAQVSVAVVEGRLCAFEERLKHPRSRS